MTQQIQQFIDVSSSEIWEHDSFKIDHPWGIDGSAYTKKLPDNSRVVIIVESRLINDNEDQLHIPLIEEITNIGTVVSQVAVRESKKPTTAIKNAVQQGEIYFKDRQHELSK
jgi:hypothetical protein